LGLPNEHTVDDIKFLLTHFEQPEFPRRISTIGTEEKYDDKQRAVYSLVEMLSEFERADWINCKINAYNYIGELKAHRTQLYPSIQKPLTLDDVIQQIQQKARSEAAPVVLFFDLDDKKALPATRKRIKDVFMDDELEPTTINTGNGLHLVLPLELDPSKYPAMPLDNTETWRDRLLPGRTQASATLIALTHFRNGRYYSIPENLSPGNMLLRFSEDFLTNDKADVAHNPSVRSCMVRSPGSYNLKRIKAGLDSEVNIIGRWNGQKKAHILFLINRFHEHLRKLRKEQIHQVEIQERKRKRILRNNRILESASYMTVTTNGKITNPTAIKLSYKYWYIEPLSKMAVVDFRKHAASMVFAPYYLNIKGWSYDVSRHAILYWLDQCDKVCSLNFDAEDKVNDWLDYIIDRSKDGQKYLPLGDQKFKEHVPELYEQLQSSRYIIGKSN
jgi:hypothetical protein